jgi:hypothetical protein
VYFNTEDTEEEEQREKDILGFPLLLLRALRDLRDRSTLPKA